MRQRTLDGLNTVDLRKEKVFYTPFRGRMREANVPSQGDAALTLGYAIKPFQGKNASPRRGNIY